MAGILFVVATPIGNLEDLTFRALRTLREVDLIAAEDTRRTARLLAHYKIQKPLRSLREHNEEREATALVRRLRAGESIALVSDAGTPGIADPGARLVARVRDSGLQVVPIPGPSAVAAAISVSGFPSDQFVFLGFPPSGGAARTQWFRSAAAETRPVVFYESPHRIHRTLSDLAQLGVRPICVHRELTKIHEYSVFQPTISPDQIHPTGEFTVVIGNRPVTFNETTNLSEAAAVFGRLTASEAIPIDELIEVVAQARHVSAARLRKLIKKQRIERSRLAERLP
jgi:16S rRNA (cytidine1402-2'-O)-methyltransferase